LTSPAENQVRDIASRIGLHEDSEILATVCHKMRKEYVVEEWQLPVLDSRQWERLHAPIGLAVAVRHLSAHQFREERLQLPFRERSNDNTQIFVSKGGDQRSIGIGEGKRNHSFSVSYRKVEDIAKTPTLSPVKPSEEEEDTIEIIPKNDFSSDLTGPSIDIDTSHTKSSSMFEAYKAMSNEKIQDKVSETEKLARTNEKEQNDERNGAHLAYDEKKVNNQYSEVCADWLELDKTALEKEELKSLEEESKYNQTTTSISKINMTSGDALDEEISDMRAIIICSTDATGTTKPMVETTNRKIIQDNKGTTEIVTESADSLELEKQENSQLGISVEVEGVGEAAEVEIITSENVDASGDSKTSKNAKEEADQLKKTPDGHRGNSVSTSIQIEGLLEKDAGAAKREEPPEASSSDSEAEDNTNIFSGIAHSVSFSEDEDDSTPNEKETSKLGCLLDQLESVEDSAISSRDDTETNLLLIPEYGADDITVAISNVSPECKKAATERKQRNREYRHEYDRESEASSFEIETTALQEILEQLPDDDHRAILSQLMIMTNARDKTSRTNLAFQVQDSLVALVHKNGIDVEPTKAVQLISQLSRLKKSYRLIFGKSLFKAMSKLYKRTEKLNKKKNHKKKLAKNSSHDRKNRIQDGQELKHTTITKEKVSRVDDVRMKI